MQETDTTPPADPRPASAAEHPLIDLDACLLPGRADSRRLLVAWYVKKSFYWLFFGGGAVAAIVHFIERVDNELQVDYRSPESVERALLSAWLPVMLALLIRLSIEWIALALALPLARLHERGLDPRTGLTRLTGSLSDQYKVAKAFRAFRWTHHVRCRALDRVSPGPGGWRRVDPVLDVLNVVGVAAFAVTSLGFATASFTDLLI